MGGEGNPMRNWSLKFNSLTVYDDENDHAIIAIDIADCVPSIHEQPLFDLLAGVASKDCPGSSIHKGDTFNTPAALLACLFGPAALFPANSNGTLLYRTGRRACYCWWRGSSRKPWGYSACYYSYSWICHWSCSSYMELLIIWQLWAHSKSSLHIFWTWDTFWRLLFMQRLTL